MIHYSLTFGVENQPEKRELSMKIFANIREYFQHIDENADSFSEYFYITRFSDFIKMNERQEIEREFSQPHKRGFFEIALITQNSDVMNIGEYTFDNVKYSLFTVSPFQVVSYNNSNSLPAGNFPKKDIDGILILFKPSFFTSIKQAFEIQQEFPFFKIHTSPMYNLSQEHFDDVMQLADQMYAEVKNPALNSTEVVRSFLLILLYKIKRLSRDNTIVATSDRFMAITSKFEHLITINNDNFLSVREYASQMNISAVYLSECVKKATGKTAQSIIIDHRILFAQSLLQQTEKPISEIALEMGFLDLSNFTKFFKRYTGLTPKQFRNDKSDKTIEIPH